MLKIKLEVLFIILLIICFNINIYAADIATNNELQIEENIEEIATYSDIEIDDSEIYIEIDEFISIATESEIKKITNIEISTQSETVITTKSEISKSIDINTKSKKSQEIEAKIKKELELGITATTKANDWHKSTKGDWYFLDKKKNLSGGWYVDNYGRWFYFDRDTGKMATGWTYIDGEKYYFSNIGDAPNTIPEDNNSKVLGQMYEDEETPDGKIVEEEGSLIIKEEN